MNREEHMEWAKKRALRELYAGGEGIQNAYASMASDLQKHKETEKHPALGIGLQLLMIGKLNSITEMEKFIKGFN